MSLFRIILAVPFALMAVYQGTGQSTEQLVARATSAPVAAWPWRPKGGDAGPSALPVKITSRASNTPQARWSYDWPMKPFGRPHPVRAYLNDPRVSMDLTQHAFHFGIDISARPGTPIYAIESGAVHVHGWTVDVGAGARTFEYWHIVPAVREGQYVGRHALLGRTRSIFNHLHLSERRYSRYVNPLRAGGLGPFADSTSPMTARLTFRRLGRRVAPFAVRGAVDIVADSADIAAGVKPEPWPVTPALLRWRILRGAKAVSGWHTAYDFRRDVLPPSRFGSVYATGTRMNHPGWAGYYSFYLAHGWSSSSLPNGSYRIEVAASDVRGNVGISIFRLTIAN
jgi:murein DD-endopeptidase MepM/ murein hydrolase activator NlpD